MNQFFHELIRSCGGALSVAVVFLAPITPLMAQGEGVPMDKSRYSLWAPTPAAELREMSTDRPDQTESPYTVDAGRFQVEVDAVNFTYDRDHSNGGDVRTEIWNFAAVNLKVGLTDRVDLQVLLEPQVRVKIQDRVNGAVFKASGFGDITTRLKINFWGNDGGKSAFGVMPFVKLPLLASDLRNGETEGGIIFPFARELPMGWGLGAMTEIDFVSDGAGGHDTEWLNSITLGRDLTAKLGGYVEFVAVTSNAPGFRWQGQVDFGVTYALSENMRLDLGCNFGVTASAPDLQPFVGFSRRF